MLRLHKENVNDMTLTTKKIIEILRKIDLNNKDILLVKRKGI